MDKILRLTKLENNKVVCALSGTERCPIHNNPDIKCDGQSTYCLDYIQSLMTNVYALEEALEDDSDTISIYTVKEASKSNPKQKDVLI